MVKVTMDEDMVNILRTELGPVGSTSGSDKHPKMY